MKLITATRLAAYLARHKLSHRAFAEKAGIPHLHPMISQFAAGKRLPGIEAAVGIERATGGEIPASYWVALGAGQRRRKKRAVRRLVRRAPRGSSQQTPNRSE